MGYGVWDLGFGVEVWISTGTCLPHGGINGGLEGMGLGGMGERGGGKREESESESEDRTSCGGRGAHSRSCNFPLSPKVNRGSTFALRRPTLNFSLGEQWEGGLTPAVVISS